MNRDKILLEEFIVNHSADAARLLEQMTFEQIYTFIEKISTYLALILLQDMDVYLAYKCLEKMEVEKSIKIFEALPVNTAAAFLRRMDKVRREEILGKSEPTTARLLALILYHPEDTVGAFIDPKVIIVPSELNVKEAFEKVKKSKRQFLNYLYVTNTGGKLLGVVKLEDVIASESKEIINNVMNTEFPHLYSEVDIQIIADHPGWLEYSALPVLDRSGIFLGALNFKVIKRLELDKTKKTPKKAILAGSALGELYRIGFTGLLNSVLTINKQTG
jgi:magnesium transporter